MKKEKPILINDNTDLIAGIDECGCGCLAGPVVASAVILPSDFYHKDLRDSKKMTIKQRESVYEYIKEHAIDYTIGVVEPSIVDEINILQARFLAMDKAIKQLKKVKSLLIDGNMYYKDYPISYTTVVKGDDKYACISAASVLAKVYRDNLMNEYHIKYPIYDWNKNKGYGTAKHIQMIKENGIVDTIHRLSFLKNII